MNTLIIHPEDPSTSFLHIVYDPIPNKEVITGGYSKKEIKNLIKEYDRVMMMGHGCPTGLFSVGAFKSNDGLIIDKSMVDVLSEKKDNVFIWCNADKFVNEHNLKGFYCGMFISEVGEANYCGLPGTKQDVVDESNYGFCEIFAKFANKHTKVLYENVINEYGVIADKNPVALYNYNRLYMS